MSKIIATPGRYIQGSNELEKLCEHASSYGKKLLLLTSATGRSRVEDAINKGQEGTSVELSYEVFHGECSMTEIDRLLGLVKAGSYDVIVGIGGGKIHDTAKAVAHFAKLPIIIVPTIASTDAPCSALSVIYSEEGIFEKYLFLPVSPNMVLVDTALVCKAPSRLLAAGMGDALATYFEARACVQSDAGNFVGGKTTLAAMALARLCYDTLLADGAKAILAVENKVCTKAVENIVEANTYLSGVGFESVGIAAAHAIHNGFTAVEETHEFYHGEKVAFGTLAQLVLENTPVEELETVAEFCISVGLPVTLAELGIQNPTREKLMPVAELACAEGDTMGCMPFAVTAEDVYAAIMTADTIGRQYLED
ncbi:MAG: glycerol dehydrogenase [Lachnospiraceae bacterium]